MTSPVKLETGPRDETIALSSLVQTDNKLFNKVIMIFAYLCDQVAKLKQQAQVHFYMPLLLAAEGEDVTSDGEAKVCCVSHAAAPVEPTPYDWAWVYADTHSPRSGGSKDAATALRNAAVRRPRKFARDQLAPSTRLAVSCPERKPTQGTPAREFGVGRESIWQRNVGEQSSGVAGV